jgi:hypothetical protein
MWYRYRTKSVVIALSPDEAPGPYEIVQLVVGPGGVPHYRVRSTTDGRHRTFAESEVTLVTETDSHRGPAALVKPKRGPIPNPAGG